jgi:beta-glucosidase
LSVTDVDSLEPAYRDPTRTVAERVEDLLSRMTLAEKVAQLGSRWGYQLADGAAICSERAAEHLRDGLGQVTRVLGASGLRMREAAEVANAIQRHLLDETRLGIPAILHEEVCCGLMAREATVFPQAIGLASSWDPELVGAVANAVRAQMRAVGAHQGLSPVLDVCRDPRWGRIEETFGEDPHLVARMGVAFVRGLQGDDLRDGVIATAKHFVGYGASEGGMNWAPAHLPARELREVYLHPFEAAVKAGLRSIMNAYNEVDGVPCAADASLLTDLLRTEWGFDGFAVSDYFAIRQLADYHRIAPDVQSAAALALGAGLDVELPGTDAYGQPLLDALAGGMVSEQTIDASVRRVLRAKFDLGLFERPFVDLDAVQPCPEQRALARDAARRSIVLLRNDGILPLDVTEGSIALIGPNAASARNLLGDYCYAAHIESLMEMMRDGGNIFGMATADNLDHGGLDELDAASVLDALGERAGTSVQHALGCDVNGTSREGFEAAVALAAASDVAVMVMGDRAGLTDECTSGESRDRASLDLPGVQEELVRAVVATGTPVVLVLVAGRPVASAWAHEHCAAVLMAWMPGHEGGGAIVDVLAGDAEPGGRLPVSYPRGVGQLPVFYGHKVSGGRSHWKGDYVDSPTSPLYPFGHGLGYTTCELSGAAVREREVRPGGTVTVDVTVTNGGPRAGDEVVQLYVRDPHASLTRPVLELKGFVRLVLGPAESRRVTFEVPVGQLGFHGRDLSYVVEAGAIEVLVGRSSADLVQAGEVTIVADASDGRVAKAFDGAVSVV